MKLAAEFVDAVDDLGENPAVPPASGSACAFDDLRFDEVWTFVYVLVLLVVLVDSWSAAVRRRMTA